MILHVNLQEHDKLYKKAESAIYRMISPKRRSGKVEACDEIRKRWHESKTSRKALILEMVDCENSKDLYPARSVYSTCTTAYVLATSLALHAGQVQEAYQTHFDEPAEEQPEGPARLLHEEANEGGSQVGKDPQPARYLAIAILRSWHPQNMIDAATQGTH